MRTAKNPNSKTITVPEKKSECFRKQIIMREMALRLALGAKLSSARGCFAEMKKSLSIADDGERFADLVIAANKGKSVGCVYLAELKYLHKGKSSDKKPKRMATSSRTLRYKTSPDFAGRPVNAPVRIFEVPLCAKN